MSMTDGSVLSSYVAAPDSGTGAAGVARPCNLRGVWVLPGAGDAIVTLQFHNSTADKTGTVLFKFDVGKMSGANVGDGQFGLTLPGNGIRFDTGIWVQGEDTNTITSITLLYQ